MECKRIVEALCGEHSLALPPGTFLRVINFVRSLSHSLCSFARLKIEKWYEAAAEGYANDSVMVAGSLFWFLVVAQFLCVRTKAFLQAVCCARMHVPERNPKSRTEQETNSSEHCRRCSCKMNLSNHFNASIRIFIRHYIRGCYEN